MDEPREPPLDDELRLGRSVRWGLWAVVTAVFVAFMAAARLSTHLGVEAPSWDKSGADTVWRVWWRSRHSMVHAGPEWLVPAILLGLAAVVVAAGVTAVWLILIPDRWAEPDSTPDRA